MSLDEWATEIIGQDPIVLLACRGLTDGETRLGAYYQIRQALQSIFQNHSVRLSVIPPDTADLEQLVEDSGTPAILILEATARHDLPYTVDKYVTRYIEGLNASTKKRVLPIVIVDPVHAHAHVKDQLEIDQPNGPNALRETLSGQVEVIFADPNEVADKLKKLLMDHEMPGIKSENDLTV